MDSYIPALCRRELTRASWEALRTLLYLDVGTSPKDRRVKLRILLASVLVCGPPIVLWVAALYGAAPGQKADISESVSAWRYVFAYWTVLVVVYVCVFAYWVTVRFRKANRRLRLESMLAEGVHLRAQMIRAVFTRPTQAGEAMHMAHMHQAMAWSRGLEALARTDAELKEAWLVQPSIEQPFRPDAGDWAWQREWVPNMDDRCAKLAAVIHAMTMDATRPTA